MMDAGDMNPIASLIIIIVSVAIFLVPTLKILNKAGYSRWWVLIWLVPIVNIVMYWVFAFARWPALEAAQQQAYYGGGQQPYPYPPQGQPYPPQGQYPNQPQYPQGAYGNYPQQPPAPPPPGRR